MTDLPARVSVGAPQVGVHNGWTYVDQPQTFNLDLMTGGHGAGEGGGDGELKKTTASPSMRRSSRFHVRRNSLSSMGSGGSQGQCLVLKSRVQLNDLLQDPMFAVVFSLSYVIRESLSETDRKMSLSMARAHTRTVSVRWAAWTPFLHAGNPEVSVALAGGITRAPDDVFVYLLGGPATGQENVAGATAGAEGGLLAFRWAMGNKDEFLTVPQVSHPQGSALPRSMDEFLTVPQVSHPQGSALPRSMDEFLTVPQVSHPQGSALPGSMLSMRSSDGSDALLLDASAASSGDLRKPPSGRSPRRPLCFRGYRTPRTAALPQQQGMLGAGGMMGVGGVPLGMIGGAGVMYGQAGAMGYPMMGMGMGQPPVYMPMAYHADTFREGPGSEMRDLPFTQVHHPMILQPPTAHGGQTLSRAAYARLYSAGFPPILDRHGDPPEVLDPSLPVSVNLARENADSLQANEIIFQFLAFSKL
ncbi:hypothetical protein ACOMHN_009347 [Nucella lapillus]